MQTQVFAHLGSADIPSVTSCTVDIGVMDPRDVLNSMSDDLMR